MKSKGLGFENAKIYCGCLISKIDLADEVYIKALTFEASIYIYMFIFDPRANFNARKERE